MIVKALGILLTILFLCSYNSFAQDDSYIEFVDSLYDHNLSKKDYVDKRLRMGSFRYRYQVYKVNRKVRSILAHNGTTKEMTIFLYYKDTIVLISPLGQQPYYIKNDTLYYTQHIPYTSTVIARLTKKGYQYLSLVYTQINKKRKKG